VNGNTTVVGNLASGTLNPLINRRRRAPPKRHRESLHKNRRQAPLLTKTTPGTEIGPVGTGSGAQTSVQNTFTAQQNFDANFEAKGPIRISAWHATAATASATNPPPSNDGSINSAIRL